MQVNLENASDENLMLELKNGQDGALSELFVRYKGPLYAFIYRLLRSSEKAEDLVQETFLRVYKHRNNYKPTAKFSSWIYRIARNLCIDEQRRYWNRKVSLDSEISTEDQAVDFTSGIEGKQPLSRDVLADKNTENTIRAAVEKLSPEQKEVVLLNRFQGLSYAEISEVIGISTESVKQRAYRAHQKLRTMLSSLLEEI